MSADIVERLHRQVEEQLWYEGGYRHMTLANPDGPEAAETITSLLSRLAVMERERDRLEECRAEAERERDEDWRRANAAEAELAKARETAKMIGVQIDSALERYAEAFSLKQDLEVARAALPAKPEQLGVTEPRRQAMITDPTSAMSLAGGTIIKNHKIGDDPNVIAANVWRAMASAAPAEPAPAPTPAPTTTIPWLQPAPAGTHAQSQYLVDFLWNRGSDRVGNIGNMMNTYPVYVQSSGLPWYSITASKGNMAGGQIAFGSTWNTWHNDGQLIIYSADRRTVHEFFEAKIDHTYKKITATRADRLSVDVIQNSASRGVGIPYHHMLITDEEIRGNLIPHALSMRVGLPHCTMAWYPASKVEGNQPCDANGIPEGARFVCSFPQTRIDTWAASLRTTDPALEKFGRAVAAALRTYGFFITDNGFNYSAIDVQHYRSWSSTNPLGPLAARDWEKIQNMLDGLLSLTCFRVCVETGTRLTK